MKIQALFFVIGVGLLHFSCQKCELIDQNIVHPPKLCTGTFYFNKIESVMDTSFIFCSIDKPFSQVLNPTVKAGPFGKAFGATDLQTCFSALDSIHRIYIFEFFNNAGTAFQFYSNEISDNNSTHTSLQDFYASPVFVNGQLFTISVEAFGSDLQYSIGQVDPLTGQNGVGLAGGSAVINSPADVKKFSSTAAINGVAYFLSGTNLIEFNSLNNSTRYFDIDPSYDPINHLVSYSGLEYDSNQDVLLCMKLSGDIAGGFKTTLVSIKITPSGPQLTQVYDIGTNLPSGHSPVVSTDFYSTTFDACDTTYYITELSTFNPLTTNFIEVAIHKQKLTNHVVDGFWLGLEYVPK